MATPTEIGEILDARRPDMPFPAAIAGWEVEIGADATGEPAVWVWVIVHDDLIEQVWPMPVRDELRQQVREAVGEVVGPESFVYVRFRARSEQLALAGEG